MGLKCNLSNKKTRTQSLSLLLYCIRRFITNFWAFPKVYDTYVTFLKEYDKRNVKKEV